MMVAYRDDTPIPPKDAKDDNLITETSKKVAKWVREKMFGLDVREAIARAVEDFSISFSKNKIYSDETREIAELNTHRQDELEKKQDSLNGKFDDVIANVTVDSEVINARESDKFGKFKTLNGRLEKIEIELTESHFTLPEKTIGIPITLQDDNFSKNHVTEKIGEVKDSDFSSALIIAEIDNRFQNTFSLSKVGEIDV